MLLLKRISFMSVLCAGCLALNACAGAIFPDIDDNEEEVVVGEGGRVVKSLPEKGSSLKADTENAAYENDADDEEAEADKTSAADDDDDEALEEDKAAPAETTPVVRNENVAPAVVPAVNWSENDAPSVSYRLDTFYFNNGSAVLDSSYNAQIRKIAQEVKQRNASVTVYGYASSRTRNTDAVSHKLANFKISSERAENVAAALRRAGIPANRISVEALSDTVPAYQEVMPEGERLNRRAEVYISY